MNMFVSYASSYDFSFCCLFYLSLSLFSGMVTWEESMSTAGEEWLEGLKNTGGGNNTKSVLEGLGPQPMCIVIPKLAKWLKIRSRPFSRSLLLSNKNHQSSTYSTQNSSKIFPDLKEFILWLTIWTVERGTSSSVDQSMEKLSKNTLAKCGPSN